MLRYRRLLFVLLTVCPVIAIAGGRPAAAFTVAQPGYAVFTFAKKFTCCLGPLGVAFDSADHLFVADNKSGRLYRFGWQGGNATTPLNKTAIAGGIDGLAFGKDGELYLARFNKGDIVQINPRNGKIVRTVTKGIRCAGGLAVDPLSGDLFVSQPGCTNKILRIPHPATCGSSCLKTTYLSPGGTDGITFGPDGTLYSTTNGCAYMISPTTITPATATLIACPHNKMDGIALSATSAPDRPLIFANGNNGTIVKIDQSATPPAVTTILSGGSRGDFVTVGPDGCLYATQSKAIQKVTGSDGNCTWSPTSVIPQLEMSPDQRPAMSIGTTTSFTVTVTHVSNPQGIPITFEVQGAVTSKQIVPADAQGAATISITGRKAGTARVIATTRVGKTTLRSNPGQVSWTP